MKLPVRDIDRILDKAWDVQLIKGIHRYNIDLLSGLHRLKR